MDNKRLLNSMIAIYENDFMCGYNGNDKERLQVIFLKLIMYVTRYVNDHRYCYDKACECSPESHIKYMLEKYDKEINEKLLGGNVSSSGVLLKLQEISPTN